MTSPKLPRDDDDDYSVLDSLAEAVDIFAELLRGTVSFSRWLTFWVPLTIARLMRPWFGHDLVCESCRAVTVRRVPWEGLNLRYPTCAECKDNFVARRETWLRNRAIARGDEETLYYLDKRASLVAADEEQA